MVLGDRARSEDERLANYDLVSEGYFRTLGVPVVAGREFTEGDRLGAPRVAVINASMARYYFGEASAVGRQFRVGEDASAPVVTIVGVAKDIKNKGPREAPDRRFYLSYFQAEDLTPGLQFQLKLSGPPEVVAPMVRAAIRRIDATLDIRSMDTVETTYRRLLVRDRLMANLAATFGVLAALLAATGLYGVLAYTVTRRAREIGIRMALGARRAEIARLVVRDGGLMVLVGAVIGLPAALLACPRHGRESVRPDAVRPRDRRDLGPGLAGCCDVRRLPAGEARDARRSARGAAERVGARFTADGYHQAWDYGLNLKNFLD